MSDLKKFAESIDIQGIVKNVRTVINPELAVPADEKDNPVNYRIVRLKKMLDDVATLRKALDKEMDAMSGHLQELLIELNADVIADASKKEVAAEADKADVAAKEEGVENTLKAEEPAKEDAAEEPKADHADKVDKGA